MEQDSPPEVSRCIIVQTKLEEAPSFAEIGETVGVSVLIVAAAKVDYWSSAMIKLIIGNGDRQ
jgi:hypothetical protein